VQVPGAESLDFRDVEAFSTDFAYLLSAGPGDQSRIYKTTDGGRNWRLQFTNHDPKGFFDCIAFWDRDHGIALGDPVAGKFALITTNNGGDTWERIPSEGIPAAVEGEGAFAASGTCITVQGNGNGNDNAWFATGGKAARVFHSSDRGKNWTVAETPIVHGNDSSGIFSIAFRDSLHGVIAGGDYKNPQQDGPNLAFTDDGGITWRLAPISPQFYFSGVVWGRVSSPALLAVGSAHAACAGSSSDKSWEKTWDLNLNSVVYYAPGKAIAVGPKGVIVKFVIPR